MLSQEQEAFVRAQRVAHLATANADSQPFVIPVCFVYTNGLLYTPVDEKPKGGKRLRRLRNIEENPQVALVFDRYEDDWERLAWVLLRGKASLVTDAGEKAQALAALRRKYEQYRAMALEERPLIRIEPERAASWGTIKPPGASAVVGGSR
ncbi:MAG: TIGR03668 family PPOX class F420-dependent oxidoreductase [Chloroflexi bacterium]|nr:TIGR03668 family PPOX class F420-dependent oxidoreductase [Chloroflexota bacterium]